MTVMPVKLLSVSWHTLQVDTAMGRGLNDTQLPLLKSLGISNHQKPWIPECLRHYDIMSNYRLECQSHEQLRD